MSDATDMATPVTRGEMRAELEQFEARFDQKLEMWGGALLARIESGERRLEQKLEMWGGALLARIESGERRVESMEQRLIECIDASERRLLTELARHTRANYEDMSTQISVIDEKYADLPPRVSRLEIKTFPPRRR